MSIRIDIYNLTELQAKEKLSELIEWLDELSGEDFFGSEGWEHMIGWDNK